MAKTGKTVSNGNGAVKQIAKSTQLGNAGLDSSADYKRFLTAIAVDVINGSLGFKEAGSAGAQIGRVIKIVELEHRYGYSKNLGKRRGLLIGS